VTLKFIFTEPFWIFAAGKRFTVTLCRIKWQHILDDIGWLEKEIMLIKWWLLLPNNSFINARNTFFIFPTETVFQASKNDSTNSMACSNWFLSFKNSYIIWGGYCSGGRAVVCQLQCWWFDLHLSWTMCQLSLGKTLFRMLSVMRTLLCECVW